MGASNAERQRRYRAHKRGDHTLCDPSRCDPSAVMSTVTAVTPEARNATATTPNDPITPTGLGPRGERLWRDAIAERKPGPAQLVLLEEACRIADRLDRLDALIGADSADWVEIEIVETKGNPERQEVVIDKVLSEARQYAVALKQIVSELRQAQSAGPGQSAMRGRAGTVTPTVGTGGGGGVADLTARIAAKRGAQTAG